MGAGLGIACLAHLPTTISDPPLFPPSGRHLRYEKALISTKGRLQAFMCCTWVHDTAVAGTADGHLYTFEPVDGRLSRDLTITKKAHDDMITSMCTYVGGLCTGGKVSCQLKPNKKETRWKQAWARPGSRGQPKISAQPGGTAFHAVTPF